MTPRTCKFARAGRRQPQIGLVARPASPAQRGKGATHPPSRALEGVRSLPPPRGRSQPRPSTRPVDVDARHSHRHSPKRSSVLWSAARSLSRNAIVPKSGAARRDGATGVRRGCWFAGRNQRSRRRVSSDACSPIQHSDHSPSGVLLLLGSRTVLRHCSNVGRKQEPGRSN